MAKEFHCIETTRLFLRNIEESDAETIVRWRSDPAVYRFFKSPHKLTIEEHLSWYRTRYAVDDNRFDFMCLERDGGCPVGVFGLIINEDSAELNYLLAPYAQHKGYAKEALEGLIEFASTKKLITTFRAEIHKENLPSVILIKRLGFVFSYSEGDFSTYCRTIE